jgi:hypothetical protein
MEARSRMIATLQSTAELQLQRADGSTATLDSAILIRRPDSVRVRAWKLGHAALDLTLNSDGLWVKTGDQNAEPAADDLREESVLRALQLVIGEWPQSGVDVADRGGQMFDLISTTGDGDRVECTVDRATLTPRRYRLIDAAGQIRATVEMDRYALIGEILWPFRVVARAEHGSATIRFSSVHINEELPARAFEPPAGARKQE